jgi:hypothetical protein
MTNPRNSFIWQYLDVPQEEVTAIQESYKNAIPNNTLFYQNLKIDKEYFCNLKILFPALIQCAPWSGFKTDTIHIDLRNSEVHGTLALNIPLEHCEGSTTKFWKSTAPTIIEHTSNNYDYSYFDPKYCEQISEFKLNRPVLFDTDIPHNVVNPQPVWRRAISLRFAKDPWHLVGL